MRVRTDGFGERGEALAARYLRRQGLRILETNCKLPQGEIDIVATEGTTIVFAEVKTRHSDDIRDALEAVGPAKQRKLTDLAIAYLKKHRCLERPARFDVVGIVSQPGQEPVIQHIRGAFEAVGKGQMFS